MVVAIWIADYLFLACVGWGNNADLKSTMSILITKSDTALTLVCTNHTLPIQTGYHLAMRANIFFLQLVNLHIAAFARSKYLKVFSL